MFLQIPQFKMIDSHSRDIAKLVKLQKNNLSCLSLLFLTKDDTNMNVTFGF